MNVETIKQALIAVIGEYTPDSTLDGMAQMDWAWIASSVMFIVLMVTFFKAIRFVLGGLGRK